ncbi:acetylxylan esterase [Flexivirga alba]|uniref:Acetylxylan esterase n=1 Tax=Flexivirga alba TaxID=702742 RepID=A0ABW2AAR3_9MICO
MPEFDLPLDRLESYLPDRREPQDWQSFWDITLAETRAHDLAVESRPAAAYLPNVITSDMSFAGFGGHRINAWHIRPRADVQGTVVQFLGYGDGRGTPLDWLGWPAAGFATLVMDTRGQGARARRAGNTGDPAGSNSPYVEGFLTQGILDPHDYFYRRVFADAVRAIEAALTLDGTDPEHLAVAGASQGGAIALAATALAGDLVRASVIGVPFLADVRRAVRVTEERPYFELLAFLGTHRSEAETALRTMDYVDGITLAAHATAPAKFSIALMDTICPPSGGFGVYNHYAGPKQVDVHPYNNHEGGEADDQVAAVEWLQGLWS